jgi:hypothetical protein
MVFACANRHVAVNGNTKREISDALDMGASFKSLGPRRLNRYQGEKWLASISIVRWRWTFV